METNQITANPPKREGILPSVKFNPKSYGIEYVDFSYLKSGDMFHFYFMHIPQNEIYLVTETGWQQTKCKLVLGEGNKKCPFLGYGPPASGFADKRCFELHSPFREGWIGYPSRADVIRIKRPKIYG